ncbi:MAG: hypothetical protein R8G01_22375 [Ilumatobacteraceae bacterium]|nr:hypothetical protein [Ilumatobacteraceae bacterium]
MSDLNTILFAVGSFVFMLTVYGAVLAGGAALKHKQLDELPDGTNEVVDRDGFEYFVTAPDAADEPASAKKPTP